MVRIFKVCFVLFAMLIPFVFSSCSHARPPKPGPDFVWVKPHRSFDGTPVPGHWRYVGAPKAGREWIPAHRTPDGTLVQGHWSALPSPRPGAAWVPGHFGPGGRWVPGHWR